MPSFLHRTLPLSLSPLFPPLSFYLPLPLSPSVFGGGVGGFSGSSLLLLSLPPLLHLGEYTNTNPGFLFFFFPSRLLYDEITTVGRESKL